MSTGSVAPAANVLFLCTGNAARSVMAGVALGALRPDLTIETAGTLTVDGLPISWRTRAALDAFGLAHPQHRSKQATSAQLARADVIVGLAPEHVEWVRRNHPSVAGRAATLVHLSRHLPTGSVGIAERLARLLLGAHELSAEEEIVDPGGGEVEAFVAAAQHVVGCVEDLAPRL